MTVSSQEALNHLIQFVEKESYKGYDPYDILTSPLKIKKLGLLPSAIAIQIQKRNPINLRPLAGVKKGTNPKGIGLFLHAYSLLYQHTGDESYRPKMDHLFKWLLDNPTPGYSGLCWGYNFDWASSKKYLDAYSPTIVVSGFIAKAMRKYYEATQDDRAVEALQSISKFVLNDLEATEDDTGVCYSYSTAERDLCFNASLLGGELFASLYNLTGDDAYKEKAMRAAQFALSRQKEDGRWTYSIDVNTGKEREQIDFHQGYVIDSLFQIGQNIQADFSDAITKGMRYYRERQFKENGQCLWRVPSEWPTDIHNQAQGIVSFSRLKHLSDDYLPFANTIADWTIANMRNRNGSFQYKKYPLYRIKTPMIRWSQGWMMLALAELHVANGA